VQSFDDDKLAAIGRIHGGAEARRAVASALEIFGNVNIDLMYALPAQTPAQSAADIREAIAFGAPHISAYHLTLEPGNAVPSQSAVRAGRRRRGRHAGLARGGVRCRRLRALRDIGIRENGIPLAPQPQLLELRRLPRHRRRRARESELPRRIRREVRLRQPQAYMRAALSGKPLLEAREVAESELPFEFMLNALRLVEGFPIALFAERTGLAMLAIEPQMKEAEALGLIARDHEWVRPTDKGRRFLNDLLERFLPRAGARGAHPHRESRRPLAAPFRQGT
jgi:oxygen-independent coproporphyrinogen-3 oxidase